MHKKLFVTLFFCFAFHICQLPVFAETQATLALYNYPPYCDSEGNGLHADLFKAAFAEAGVDAKISVYPVKRGIFLFLRGEVDMFQSAALIPADKADQYDSVKVSKTAVVLFYLKPHHKGAVFQSLKEIKGYKVAVIVNSPFIPMYEKNGVNVYQAQNPEQMFKLLEKGRVDFLETSIDAGLLMISKMFQKEAGQFDNFTVLSVDGAPAFLQANERSRKMKSLFEKGLGGIIKNGRYMSILESYWAKGNVPKSYLPDELKQFGVEKVDIPTYVKAKGSRKNKFTFYGLME